MPARPNDGLERRRRQARYTRGVRQAALAVGAVTPTY
jgi:hypothetical protein